MNRNSWIAIAVGVFVIGFFFFSGTLVEMFRPQESENLDVVQLDFMNSEEQTGTQNLLIEDIVLGSGAEAVAGSIITVHYVGTLESGQKFDSSIDRGQPFQFMLGAGQVIAGWDQGFEGMKVGGKRKLTIPPSLGYGPNAVGPIPANSTLIFEVELLGVGN
jgi:FKBP-type peptidyl-prolyl cis-trans isomerase